MSSTTTSWQPTRAIDLDEASHLPRLRVPTTLDTRKTPSGPHWRQQAKVAVTAVAPLAIANWSATSVLAKVDAWDRAWREKSAAL